MKMHLLHAHANTYTLDSSTAAQHSKSRGAYSYFSLVGKFTAVMQKLAVLSSVKQERNELAELSERELRDMGITREDAQQESEKGFFEIPAEREPR